MDFVISFIFGVLWAMLVAGAALIIFSLIGIPFLDNLTFWQIFGLVLVIDLATTKITT